MSNVVSAELFKLKHSKAFYAWLIVILALSVYGILSTKTSTAISEACTTFSALDIFFCITVAYIACDDYDVNTVKNLISSGNSRGHIYLGKLVAAMVAGLIYMFVSGIVSFVTAYFANGLGESISVISVFESLLMQLLIATIYVFMFFGISSITRSSKMGIIIGIAFNFALDFVPAMIGRFGNSDILEKYSISTLGESVTNLNFSATMAISFCIYEIMALLFCAIGYVSFKKYKA